jgi:hypothetical protein
VPTAVALVQMHDPIVAGRVWRWLYAKESALEPQSKQRQPTLAGAAGELCCALHPVSGLTT